MKIALITYVQINILHIYPLTNKQELIYMTSPSISENHDCDSCISKETIDLFRDIGVSRPIAIVLSCMAVASTITAAQIEHMSGLHQPEVSIAMKTLIEKNWVAITDEKQLCGKGRPIKYYSLIAPMDDIMASIEYSAILQSQQILHTVVKLKARVLV